MQAKEDVEQQWFNYTMYFSFVLIGEFTQNGIGRNSGFKSWCCVIVGKAATCKAGIPYGCQFGSKQQFWPSRE